MAALAGQVVGDIKVVAPYSFPAYSYVYHSAAVPSFRSAAVHYAAPKAVQYSIPRAVQYVAAAPAVQAVQYAAAPVAAVRAAPTVYSAATYSRPAAAVIKKVEFDDDDDDVRLPLTYSGYTGIIRDASLEDDDDWHGASPFGYRVLDDDDRYDFDDDRK